MYYIK